MTKVIGIRAGNGAGKTWVAQQVMKRSIFMKEFQLELALGTVPINIYEHFIIIGKYRDIACGGADTVKVYASIWDAIVHCSRYHNVIFEGVLVGTVFQPTMDLVERLTHEEATYVPICLSTSFDQCVENVNSRRAVEGKGPLARTDNIRINYKKHISSAKKFQAAGMKPYWVTAEEAVDVICKELRIE